MSGTFALVGNFCASGGPSALGGTFALGENFCASGGTFANSLISKPQHESRKRLESEVLYIKIGSL